jgi:N-acetylglucosamine-6-sulfatase
MQKTLMFAVLIGLFLSIGFGLPKEQVRSSLAQAQDRPNIIFVLTDDQFPGTQNRMPRLKSDITSEGVTFTNMVSTFPLCCPGRATIQRGQYAHNTHIFGNSLPRGGWEKFQSQGLHKSTIATWLNQAGYQTALFGKYMNNYRDRLIPPGWDRWYAWNGPKEGWTSVNDQGRQKPLERQEADSLVSKAALRFLDARLRKKAPVFAFVNFGAMHEPYDYAQVDDKKFRGVGVPRTPAFNEADVSDKPDYVRKLPRHSSKKISELDRSYRNGLRSLMRVDRFIGDASDLLRRKGEMDNTYFVFYTDNGAHFGQHRFGHGKLQPYEEDVNFPLIIRGPGIPHGVLKPQLVGNHDIAPTLSDIANAAVPAFVDGRSFLPLATGAATSSWPRTAVLSERETDGAAPNKWDMLRMSGKVYTRHQGGEKEYYDLVADPYQVHNALGASDTTYPPPDPATRAYYEQRLDDLYGCAGQSCRAAENASLLPPGIIP